jgi:hypothetical protein
MTQQMPADLPAPFRLSRMITSLWVPQTIYTAAALGLADAMADGPRRSGDLAAAVGAHPGALHRLLRGLVALELCTVTDDGRFELTPLGACLRSDTRDSVRAWALLMGGRVWLSWGRLLDCVRTGDAVPTLEGKATPFDDMTANSQGYAVFSEAMVQLTRHLAGAVAESYDFSGIRTIVDVGGGYGALLPPILAANPEMRGTVVDLPPCREGALRLFEKTHIAGRCEFVAQDIFESVPAGADAYIIKSVIHDWDDERSVAILRNCRAAMGGSSRVLVVEVIVPDRPGTSPLDHMIAGTDLNMLVVTGGRERTEAEYRALLEAARLRVTRVVATPTAMSVIEAVPG